MLSTRVDMPGVRAVSSDWSQKRHSVYEGLLKLVSALPSETPIPTAPQLSVSFGVSRSTVRRALYDLEEAGQLVRNGGRGAFVTSGNVASRPLSFRLGLIEDSQRLAEIFVRSWQVGYRGVIDQGVLDALDVTEVTVWLSELLSNRDHIAIVAIGGEGGIIGFIRVGNDPDNAHRGHIFSLYVDPDSGSHGVGRALLERGLEALADRGWTDVTLWVFEANERARALYASCGFVRDDASRIEAEFGAKEIRLIRARGDASGVTEPQLLDEGDSSL